MNSITITYGDQAEAHVGMKKNGRLAKEGLSVEELFIAKEKLEKEGGNVRMYNLLDLLDEEDVVGDIEEAYIMVVENGVDILLKDIEKTYNDMYEEQRSLEPDNKYWDIRRKRTLNKHARWNLCFDEEGNVADFEGEHVGTIVSFKDVPITNKIKMELPKYFGDKVKNLKAEGNYYYHKKCGIGYHGDSERRITIGVRLGKDMNMCYQWYYRSKRVGKKLELMLKSGTIYAMSSKAVGFDWKRRSIYTLRHAAGSDKYTK